MWDKNTSVFYDKKISEVIDIKKFDNKFKVTTIYDIKECCENKVAPINT